MSSSSVVDSGGPVPVIMLPSSVDFYMDDVSTHKRVLTLYNASENLPIYYKVMCTNPSFYAVVEPSGSIPPQKCTDIVVRHVAVNSPTALNKVDKFRITVAYDSGPNAKPGGKRDVLATLHPGVPEAGCGSSSLPHGQQQVQAQQLFNVLPNKEPPQQILPQRAFYHHQPNYVACFAAVICIAALCLPSKGDESALDLVEYPWLVLTMNQKLVFAYVLGLVTMAILRVT